MAVSQCNCWIARFHSNTTSNFPFWGPEVAISPARTSEHTKQSHPRVLPSSSCKVKLDHIFPHTACDLMDLWGTKEQRATSSVSNYRPDPGEKRQDSLVLAGGSCFWVIQLMQAIRTSADGLLMEGWHFIAALVVQSGHSPHALPHQLPKIWGTRTEGLEWQWRVGNKEVI